MKSRFSLIQLVFILLACLPVSLLADLDVAFEKDTVYACKDMSIILEPSVSRGNDPYRYTWNDGSTGNSLEVIHNEEGTYLYWLEVEDNNGTKVRDSVSVSVLAECVWPGDANGDRSANHFDVLSMGVGFGEVGPLRPDAHTNWIGQTAHAWEGHDFEGVNFVHSDANGDGIVDIMDMEVVGINYTSALPGMGGSIGSVEDPSLFLDWEAATVNGDTIEVPLFLGTEDIPADSAYGLAFTLDYDPEEVGAASIFSVADSSWLGSEEKDLFRMDFAFPDLGTVDIVVTRLDQEDRDGFGRIMDIVIVIEDLTGYTGGADKPFRLSVENPRLIESRGKILPLFTEFQAIVLSGEDLLAPSANLALFPNPAQLTMTVSWDQLKIEDLYILDGSGRRFDIPVNLRNNTAVLDVTPLPVGMYTLVIREKSKAYVRRFVRN
ncbi:MAG: T9SS type A sorting domain-containing protein [Bacteroidota bacterium]